MTSIATTTDKSTAFVQDSGTKLPDSRYKRDGLAAHEAGRDAIDRALACDLTKRELKVLLVVIRQTALWSKLHSEEAHEQIRRLAAIPGSPATGRKVVARALARLAELGVIEYEPGRGRAVGKSYRASTVGFPDPEHRSRQSPLMAVVKGAPTGPLASDLKGADLDGLKGALLDELKGAPGGPPPRRKYIPEKKLESKHPPKPPTSGGPLDAETQTREQSKTGIEGEGHIGEWSGDVAGPSVSASLDSGAAPPALTPRQSGTHPRARGQSPRQREKRAETEGHDPLVQRLYITVSKTGPEVVDEAEAIVGHYSRELDRRLIDESIGVLGDRKRFPETPRWPRAVVPVLDRRARQAGIPIPSYVPARRSA